MMVINLEQIKAHLRIQYNDEDEMLENIGNKAENIVQVLMGRTLDEIKEKYGAIPQSIAFACLLIVDYYYMFRLPLDKDIDKNILPQGAIMILEPYTKESRANLMAISTQPKYDENGKWIGGSISASIYVVALDKQSGIEILHRLAINININPSLVNIIKVNGYNDKIQDFLMKRVKSYLDGMVKKFDFQDKYADRIFIQLRLKMRLLVSKAVDRVYYSENLQTGKVTEEKTKKL